MNDSRKVFSGGTGLVTEAAYLAGLRCKATETAPIC